MLTNGINNKADVNDESRAFLKPNQYGSANNVSTINGTIRKTKFWFDKNTLMPINKSSICQ